MHQLCVSAAQMAETQFCKSGEMASRHHGAGQGAAHGNYRIILFGLHKGWMTLLDFSQKLKHTCLE